MAWVVEAVWRLSGGCEHDYEAWGGRKSGKDGGTAYLVFEVIRSTLSQISLAADRKPIRIPLLRTLLKESKLQRTKNG